MKITLKLITYIFALKSLFLFNAIAQEESCCGTQVYDPQTEACCNDEEVYSTEETQTKENEEDELTFQFPEPARTLLSWAGITLDAKVKTTLNMWEGEACCNEGVVSYERGSLGINGNAKPSFSIASIPALAGAINTLNNYLDDLGCELSSGGGINVNVSCSSTITQKWENCQRSFDGSLPITIGVNANAYINLVSLQSGNTIGGANLSGSLSISATVASWSSLSFQWPSNFSPSGCIEFHLDVPLADFIDVHKSWGDC